MSWEFITISRINHFKSIRSEIWSLLIKPLFKFLQNFFTFDSYQYIFNDSGFSPKCYENIF